MNQGKIAGLYDLDDTLGKGHFAIVKHARHVFTGERVAVKVIDKVKLDEISKAHLFQEVWCMKMVQHPNIVRLYEVIDTQTKLYLVLELGDGGDMYDYIMKHENGLDEEKARHYFKQIVNAVSYCHKLHVVHRDLKPENIIFFKKQGLVKLTDFGFSNEYMPGVKLQTSCGSLAYSAPEILLGDAYDAAPVDVWSLGVLLFMLVCGQAPFNEANDSETLTMIMDCKYHLPLHLTSDCIRLIHKLLVREPDQRACLSDIECDPWMQQPSQYQDTQVISPLITQSYLSDDDHNLIIQKMVNGNIADIETINRNLEANEYNHITATYYLMAENKLRRMLERRLSASRNAAANTAPVTSEFSATGGSSTGAQLSSADLIDEKKKNLEPLPLFQRVPPDAIDGQPKSPRSAPSTPESGKGGNNPENSKQSAQKFRRPTNRSLQSRRSEPQLLNQIYEEKESDDDDELDEQCLAIPGQRRRSMHSPDQSRRKDGSGSRRSTPTRSSFSDVSDDDVDNRLRCRDSDRSLSRFRNRRDSGENSRSSSSSSINAKLLASMEHNNIVGSNTMLNNCVDNVTKSISSGKSYKNELRESLNKSNLSVCSNTSSVISSSKYAIDPTNNTPSDSDSQSLNSWKLTRTKYDLNDMSTAEAAAEAGKIIHAGIAQESIEEEGSNPSLVDEKGTFSTIIPNREERGAAAAQLKSQRKRVNAVARSEKRRNSSKRCHSRVKPLKQCEGEPEPQSNCCSLL